MEAIREYNNVEAFYHGVSEWNYSRLLDEAQGKVADIVLYGRVFNPEMSLRKAERFQDYEEVHGAGYVYATDYDNRENATPGTSAMAGVTLILGWDGVHDDDVVCKSGEFLVPLSSYKVIGVVG